jgi:hypothetical protein
MEGRLLRRRTIRGLGKVELGNWEIFLARIIISDIV